MQRLNDINERFYLLYGRVYANKKFLTVHQYKHLTRCLFEQYVVEYKKFYLEKKIEDKNIIFTSKRNGRLRIPHKFLFFKNKPARLIIKNLKLDVEKNFDVMKEEIKSKKAENN